MLRYLEDLDTARVHVEQIVTLQDDNIGFLPQIATHSVHRLIEEACRRDWIGYCTRFWPIGDLDPVSAYLSDASWNDGITPEGAYRDHLTAVYGEESVRQLTQALRLLEDATVILDLDHLSLFFFVNDNLSRRFGRPAGTVMSDQLWHVKSTYEEVGRLLAETAPMVMNDASQRNLRYWRARVEFSVLALSGLARIEDGNRAYASGNRERASGFYEQALSAFRNALGHLAANVRGDSDRGALAVYYDAWIRHGRKAIDRLEEM